MNGTAWQDVPAFLAFSDGGGEVRAELAAPGCDRCIWAVFSEAAWSVERLQLFSDPACATAVPGHAVAAVDEEDKVEAVVGKTD